MTGFFDRIPGYEHHDHWLDEQAEDDYLHSRLAHEADDRRKQNKESSA